MDNSVYQPLSHALNPPPADTRPAYARQLQLQTTVDRAPDRDRDARADTSARHEEEEEEEEVEGAVVGSGGTDNHAQSQASPAPQKRRPGRPKGSKNKKPRFDVPVGSAQKQQFPAAPVYYNAQAQTSQQQQQQQSQQQQPQTTSAQMTPQSSTSTQPAAPYPAPDPSNQALYDFQWRVLSLCSEFYNAADELIRNAPQHVLHQCFSLPGNQVDPITLLHEARKACDQLMTNPTAVVLKVPPQPASQYSATTPAKSASPSAPVITNPGSFVVPLGGTAVAPTTPQGAYSAATGYQNQTRYPTAPYYAYSTQPTSGPYLAQQVMKPVNLSTPSAAGNQGAWSDEESEKLKQLTEDSKRAGQGSENGEIDWDWVCNSWGPGRTRHQILIKATSLGLKESSSRATKRRRDTEPVHGAPTDSASNGALGQSPGMNGVANTSPQAVLNAVTAAAASTTSPPHERPASTSVSPVQVHAQQPAAPPAPPGGGNLIHWPVSSPSPIVSSGTLGSRSVYYPRDRNGSKA